MIRRFILLILLLGSLNLWGDDYFRGEIIYNLSLNNREGSLEYSDDYEEQVLKEMLEEARYYFSAMIYGSRIVYTPSDKKRRVDRSLIVEPIASIPWGDKGLELYDQSLEGEYLHLFFQYRLNDYQKRRVQYWNSGLFDTHSAYGEYSLFKDKSRLGAVEDGFRTGLESYLKPIYYNKPRMIEAELLLREFPLLTIDSGNYKARVKLVVDLKNVQQYRVNN